MIVYHQPRAFFWGPISTPRRYHIEVSAGAQPREWVAGGIMVLFILANVLMLYAVYRLVWLDQSNLEAHLITPADRIISNQVIMALLGATAVQVGAIAAIIARYLFPGRQP